MLEQFQRHGFVGLTFYDSGARSIYNRVRPVRTLADLKGMRIRVQQSDLMVAMIKALGAESIELPYGQVSTGLSTRLIDGAENNWPSYVTTGHYKLAPYYTLTGHTMGPRSLSCRCGHGKAFRRTTGDLSGCGTAVEQASCAACGPDSRCARSNRRAPRATPSSATSTASHSRTRWGRSTEGRRSDQDLQSLIERIRKVQ